MVSIIKIASFRTHIHVCIRKYVLRHWFFQGGLTNPLQAAAGSHSHLHSLQWDAMKLIHLPYLRAMHTDMRLLSHHTSTSVWVFILTWFNVKWCMSKITFYSDPNYQCYNMSVLTVFLRQSSLFCFNCVYQKNTRYLHWPLGVPIQLSSPPRSSRRMFDTMLTLTLKCYLIAYNSCTSTFFKFRSLLLRRRRCQKQQRSAPVLGTFYPPSSGFSRFGLTLILALLRCPSMQGFLLFN